MKTYGIGLVSFIGLFAMLAGCAEQGHRMSTSEMSEKKRPNIKSQMVNLVVANNGRGEAELRITNARSEQCNKSSNDDRYLKGCIFAGLNDVVIAPFTLHGLADWYFDEFQICEAVNFRDVLLGGIRLRLRKKRRCILMKPEVVESEGYLSQI